MGLRIALGLLALLALVSGLMKLRERMRPIVGVSLGLVEILAGIALGMAQGPNMASRTAGLSLGIATLGILAFSNAVAISRARKHSLARGDSEGARLYSRIKYQAALEGDTLPGSNGDDPA